MANYNLTSQQIKDTYEQLGQVSGSIEGGVSGSAVVDGTGSRINTLHVTASQATSASFATTALSASYAPGTGVTSIIAGTGISVDQATGDVTVTNNAAAIATGSLLVTASNVDATITYTKGDGSTFQNIINNVANATSAEDLVITVKNTSGGTLAKGTAVHAVGVTGENVEVIAASNVSGTDMPAIGLLSQEISNNASGTCIIQGRETGIDTSNLIAGSPVYVNSNGTLTATRPTGSALIQNIGTAAKINGSDGEIIIQGAGRTNDLPNITEGYAWVGDTNGVPQAVATSSFAGDSFPYTGSARITGSLGVTGSIEVTSDITGSGNIKVGAVDSTYVDVDWGININHGNIDLGQTINGNYWGIKVGSPTGPTRTPGILLYTSASQFAGQSNSVGVKVLDNDYSSSFVGQIQNLGGSGAVVPANQAVFAVQGGALGDSIIGNNTIFYADNIDGSPTFTKTAKFERDVIVTGSLEVLNAITASSATFQSASIGYLQTVTGSATIIGSQYVIVNADSPTARFAGLKVYDSGSGLTGSFEWDSVDDNWVQVETGGSSAGMLTGASGSKGSETYPSANTLLKGTGNHTVVDSSITDSGTFVNIQNPTRIAGDSNITGSFGITGSLKANGNTQVTGSLDVTSTITNHGGSIQSFGGGGITVGNSGYALQYPSMNVYTNSGSYGGQIYGSHRITDLSGNGDVGILALSTFNSGDPNRICFETQFNGDVVWWISENKNLFHVEKEIKAIGGLQATGSVDITGSLTLNGSAIGGPATSASFAATASYVNSLDQELIITGSVQNNVVVPVLSGSFPNYTASIDCSAGNIFDIDLDNGSTYHFEANNLQKGQTFMLRTPQSSDGNGQIDWGSMFNWPAGVAPTATQAQNTADVYTFVTFDTTSVYAIQSADLK
jgi:hypothetical protein